MRALFLTVWVAASAASLLVLPGRRWKDHGNTP